MPKSWTGFLLDFVFPPFCQGCTAEGSYLCLPCSASLESPIHRCIGCGKNSPLGQIHEECRRRDSALTGLLVAAEYRAPAVRNLVWQLKYNSVRDISQTIALIMADYLIRSDLADYFSQSMIVPIPMHQRRTRFRGFNQAEEIAKILARHLGFDYCNLLVKLRSTIRQVDLERKRRLENLHGAFGLSNILSNKLRNKKIILIDDVATTGATLNECAQVLQKLEPAEIWGLVVARN